jgi:FK506-binding nuclear protein
LASEDAFFYVLTAKYLYRSIELKGGEEKPVDLPTNVQITNISLGENLVDSAGRTVVKLTYSFPHTSDDDDEDEDEDKDEGELPRITTVLCALTPGKVIQLFCC